MFGVYTVYDGTVSGRNLKSKNGLYIGTALIGMSKDQSYQGYNTEAGKRALLDIRFQNQNSIQFYCYKGIKYICLIMKKNNKKVRKRKCYSYLHTDLKRVVYSDTSITDYAETLFNEIQNDPIVCEYFVAKLHNHCASYAFEDEHPVIDNCTDHLFGFQREVLRNNIRKRAKPTSRKSKALQECLEKMERVIANAHFTHLCINNE